jgi:hypothetical protein
MDAADAFTVMPRSLSTFKVSSKVISSFVSFSACFVCVLIIASDSVELTKSPFVLPL